MPLAQVGEKDLASKQFDATKQDAIRRQEEEQQARLKSEAEHATALDQLEAQRRRADRWASPHVCRMVAS